MSAMLPASSVVYTGHAAVQLRYVAGAKWEGPNLFVYLSGGGFLKFTGDDTWPVWDAITRGGSDLGEGQGSNSKESCSASRSV
jgi:hypothetical protein